MQEETARRFATQTSLMILTVAGVVIDFGITAPMVFSFASSFQTYFPSVLTFLTLSEVISLFVLSFIFPLLYPIVVAYFLRPKGIISSLNILVGTWAIDAFLLATTIPRSPVVSTAQGDWFVVVYVLGFVSFFVGFYETSFVRWLLGLNFEGVNKQTFVVNVPAKPIYDILSSEEYFPRYKKRIKVNEPGEVLVIKREAWGTDYVVVGLAKNPDAPHASSIVAFVSYKQGIYDISESISADDERDLMKLRLEEHLKADYSDVRFEPKKNFVDMASTSAFGVARAPSDSKVSISQSLFKELPRSFQAILGFTILSLVLIPALAYFTIGTGIDYASIFAIFVALLLGEVAFAVREEIVRGRAKKADWPSS